jgi:hypothetical protein
MPATTVSMNAQSDDSDQFASSDQASDLKAKPFGREEFLTSVAPLILRLALAVTILSAVADRSAPPRRR